MKLLISLSQNSKGASKKGNRTSRDVRKVWLLHFYNRITESMRGMRTRRSVGDGNGDDNAAKVNKCDCLWLEWKVIVCDRTRPLRLSGGWEAAHRATVGLAPE